MVNFSTVIDISHYRMHYLSFLTGQVLKPSRSTVETSIKVLREILAMYGVELR